MKDIEVIKKELQAFDIKYSTFNRGLKTIESNTLTELFNNISTYIGWCKITTEKAKEFNSIFNNELVVEDGILLCNCTGLESITIPNSITTIGKSAFEGCTELILVTIPNSVTIIEDFAFSDCRGLTSIIIPDSVTSIGDFAFSFCYELTSIVIPNSITVIGYFAFCGCNNQLKYLTQ